MADQETDAALTEMATEVLGLIDNQKQINESLKVVRKSLKQKSARLVNEMQRVDAEEIRGLDGRVMRLNTEMKVALVD